MLSLFFGSSGANSAQTQRSMPSSGVQAAIAEGARRTGVDFSYMLKTAERESALNPSAKASTSSARGLYQFIDQTWFATLKTEGERHGLGAYADAIIKGPDGRYSVPDADMRRQILALKDDPQASATMAGAFTNKNAADLRANIGRNPTSGELYMAHVLGANGAAKLISTAGNSPSTIAARLFPEAASANRNLFYHKGGTAKSVAELYSGLASHHGQAVAQTNPATIVSAVSDVQGSVSDRFMAFGRPSQSAPQGLFAGASASALSPMARQAIASRTGPLDLGLFRTV